MSIKARDEKRLSLLTPDITPGVKKLVAGEWINEWQRSLCRVAIIAFQPLAKVISADKALANLQHKRLNI